MGTPDADFSAAVRMGFVLDVVGYGGRSARDQIDIQHRLAELTGEVLRDVGLEVADTYREGTGDGMAVFLPAEVEVHRVLMRLIRSTSETLAEDNQRYRDRMRLRMAFVIGPVGPGPTGFSGDTIVAAARMVDSEVLREAMAERPWADLAVLVSDPLYNYAVGERHAGLRVGEFRSVEVRTKEFHAHAWLWAGAGRQASTPPALRRYRAVSPDSPACLLGIRAGEIMRVHDVDIWVNSENTDMEMPRFNDFSVSSIIRYNGATRDTGGRIVADVIADELVRVVGQRRPVVPGAVFVTGSGALAATNGVRWIIHAAAVQGEPGAGFQQVRRVGACVTNALAQADQIAAVDDGARTILFPMLGTGVGGASISATATKLVDAAVDYLLSTPGSRLQAIYFLGYRGAERAALTLALEEHPSLRVETQQP